MAEAPALPEGWVERVSRKREGVKYYFHEATGETTWERPTQARPAPKLSAAAPGAAAAAPAKHNSELPAGWDEAMTPGEPPQTRVGVQFGVGRPLLCALAKMC